MAHPRRRRLLALVGGPLVALAALLLAMRGVSRREGPRVRNGDPAREAPVSATAARAATATSCAGPPPAPQSEAFEQRVVELVNAQRRASGLPPLKRVEPLTSSARWFAQDMASEDYFAADHASYRRDDGRLVRACEWSARLGWYYPGWTSLAENTAAGDERPEQVVAGWLASPNHRANVFGRTHWETGAGYWAGGSQRHYWVQDFGRRDGVFPLVIEDEARATAASRVGVYVYGSWREMRLRNDDEPWGPWRTFAASFEWTLRELPGTRRLSVELRDNGRSASASDTIELERAPPPA